MRISPEQLREAAGATGFRPEIVEKALQLMRLLQALNEHPGIKDKFVLKGGTALNLFYFDAPRLSVDIDLNYVGASGVDEMRAERPLLERNMEAACSREGFAVRRMPQEHAGGKWRLKYPAARGGEGNLEMDVNYLLRVQLWPAEYRDSFTIGSNRVSEIALLDLHEIAAGKLAALLSRGKARDLFDVHQLFRSESLDPDRLRLAFLVYGGMNRRDWREVSATDVRFEQAEIERQLVPMLRSRKTAEERVVELGEEMVNGCREALDALLPFKDNEIEFLDCLLDSGDIRPELLTDDRTLQEKLRNHPGLLWKAQNVKEHKKRR